MRKIVLTLLTLMSSTLMVHADETPQDGIFVWTSGSSTCYKLESVPKISYKEIDGVINAVLTLKDKSTPELTLPLKDDATLKVTYGIYNDISSPSTQNSPLEVRQDGKYILGGHLIIIKDGKQYNINGIIIK